MDNINEAAQAKRGWTLELNGEKVETVSSLKLINTRFGILEYGLTPQGYDVWSFHENGGGGSVILPYSKIGNEIFIGVVEQFRQNQGARKVLNAPRGFLAAGENHFGTAVSELEQEAGIRSVELSLLEGSPMNSNSAFFVTNEGEGVRFYSFEVKEDELIHDSGLNTYIFNPNVLVPISKGGELVFGCRFIPWKAAVELGDMFTVAGVGRLLAAL
jgi:hypothetical protein